MQSPPRPSRAAAAGGLVVLVLAAGPWLAPSKPEPLGPSAPDDVFSADRAWRWVDRLAVAPRPMGSQAHDAARELLVARLRQLGLDVEEQERVITNDRFVRWSGAVSAVRARNVVGRLPGTDPSGAILLAAHYDSHPTTPGAADDAMGVAAILETVRALRAGPPLRHDVHVLFTDAEEVGLLGARAFAADRARTAPVRAFLNFEARGNAAQVTMFRVTSPDAAFVSLLDRHVPSAFSTSFAAAVARLLPNDTDFTEFARAGLIGLDFANTGGWSRYHAATDTAADLDRGTLQHHGEYALGLTRALASLPSLDVLSKPGDASWFISGRLRVAFPRDWELPISIVVLLLALLAAYRPGERPRRVEALLAAFAVPGFVVLAAAGSYLSDLILKRLHPEYALTPSLSPAVVSVHLAGFAALAVSGVSAAARGWSTKASGGANAGVAVVWSALAVAASVAVPGAALILVVPALALAVAGLIAVWDGGWGRVASFSAAIVALLFWRPVWSALADTFGLGLPVAIGAVSALVATAALDPLGALASRPLAALALNVLPLALFVTGHFRASFDEAHPRPTHLAYVWDAEAGTGHVVTEDRLADAWTHAHVDEAPLEVAWPGVRSDDGVTTRVRARAVAGPTLPPAGLSLVSERIEAGIRHVVLRVTPPEGSGTTSVRIDASPSAASLEGVALPSGVPRDAPVVWFGDDAFDLSFATTETRPFRVRTASRSPGWPDGLAVRARPPDTMPTPANALPPRDPLRWSDSHVVTSVGVF